MEFCDALLDMENDDYDGDNTISRIIFSDEATFFTNGHVNRHNVRIYEPNTDMKQFSTYEIPLR
ncbi:hypothetical protein C0J52_00359 [Blattella germanica]|nr:hypothetical protein C0J52_00359 [Blattella germanica]